ncbi:hypothetical protein BT67DRAFT_388965 [Trichocladium antarcticum]|uniref:F-box domain-containing protein n=1 Tax=Trichocladium antarcticum TaxID=1450529 RepID=A0AAN6UGD2_9PEZI|nr:hypothetical protein BT67DRAFT_388965 [Trichocladium antarcticum]
MSLLGLPYELVCHVVRHLDLGDVCSLSYSCRGLQFLLHEPNVAKLVLEAQASYSPEARDARVSRRYAAELRRLIKRRDAVASVSPYLVAIVAFAETWLYEKGILCYVRGSQLRMSNLHRSATHELVVDIRKLVDQAIDAPWPSRRFRFQILHCADDIVSCLYTNARHGQASCSSRLVVFNPRAGEIITVRRLESTAQIFVRNNHQFLYYGTNSERGRDGYNRWVIRGFDLATRTWLEPRLDFPAVIGSDVGSTVCFEIFDGYFYGLSNQTCLEVEEVDWVSYYTCFRFPLSRDGFRDLEQPPRQQFWRRDQTEGPLDDRWTFLRIFKDETTGQLKAVESRKEWLSGRISAGRSYYTTVISFDNAAVRPAEPDSSVLEPEKTDLGTCLERPPRDPHMVHQTDDSSTWAFTLSKCPLRSYHPSTQTYIDLVDDSASFHAIDQRIRIRGGSRRLWTPAELEERGRGRAPMARRPKDQDTLGQRTQDLYKNGTDIFWPPQQDPTAHSPALADLYAVLNPPGHLGTPHGSWDERSLVYATGGMGGGPKALVFVSWDPSIYLAGTSAYPSPDGRSVGALSVPPHGSKGERSRKAAKRHPISQPDTISCPFSADEISSANAGSWRALEPAMYLDIARGYHFAR